MPCCPKCGHAFKPHEGINRYLTEREHEVLVAIWNYLDLHKRPPSYEELRATMGYASKSTVSRLLYQLEDKKWIERVPNSARSITPLERP